MSNKIPGIYIKEESTFDRIKPLELSKTTVAGFLGLAEKGPFNKPVRINNFSQFIEIFGNFTDFSYLAYSVYGFFKCGGEECVIVRIAHFDGEKTPGSISKAFLSVSSIDDKPCFILEALNEGSSGNDIKIRIWHIIVNSSLVSKLDNKEGGWVTCENYNSFAAGNFIILRNGTYFEYNRIIKINKKAMYLEKKINIDSFNNSGQTFIENLNFNLTITKGKLYEEFISLSLDKTSESYFSNKINSKSKLVRVKDIFNDHLPVESYYLNLSGGDDGVLGLTPADFIGKYNGLDNNTGIGIFEGIDDIKLIVIPDVLLFGEKVYHDLSVSYEAVYVVQNVLVNLCERSRNKFAILDIPDFGNFQAASNWGLNFDTNAASIYYPKIEAKFPVNQYSYKNFMVPPSGFIAGVYAMNDFQYGTHRVPANIKIKDAIDLKEILFEEENDFLYQRKINILKKNSFGIKIWGAKTLSSDPEWTYINIRRTFTSIVEALINGSQWLVFEPSTTALWEKIYDFVSSFLRILWQQSYLKGDTEQEAFYVICDESNNLFEDIDSGVIYADIGIAIAKPLEYIVINLISDNDGVKIF